VTARTAQGSASAPVPPAPEARFRVVDAKTADELARARRRYADSRLVLAVLYARAGLLDDADAELARLSADNADSAIVASLRASLRARS